MDRNEMRLQVGELHELIIKAWNLARDLNIDLQGYPGKHHPAYVLLMPTILKHIEHACKKLESARR